MFFKQPLKLSFIASHALIRLRCDPAKLIDFHLPGVFRGSGHRINIVGMSIAIAILARDYIPAVKHVMDAEMIGVQRLTIVSQLRPVGISWTVIRLIKSWRFCFLSHNGARLRNWIGW